MAKKRTSAMQASNDISAPTPERIRHARHAGCAIDVLPEFDGRGFSTGKTLRRVTDPLMLLRTQRKLNSEQLAALLRYRSAFVRASAEAAPARGIPDPNRVQSTSGAFLSEARAWDLAELARIAAKAAPDSERKDALRWVELTALGDCPEIATPLLKPLRKVATALLTHYRERGH